MDFLTDPVFLDRLQFAAFAIYHYMFVPLSVGFGLILAILTTKAHRSGDPEDDRLARLWTKLFAITFAVGVATGITMEFSFGTNWADYSRFVGDIFGAPLAAEALFAFFMESVFLGVLLCGRGRVGKRFYVVSSWLVFFGSCLSALWIIIANSWMQTPAGYTVQDGVAKLTDFFAAAINYSTVQRYCHVIIALLLTGALVAMAVGAYYLLKKRAGNSGQKLVRIGVIVALVCCVLMVPAAHQQAVEVSEQQPAKLAAMEGQYESGTVGMALIGYVDEQNQKVVGLEIPGLTSWLATFSFDTVYPGVNDFAEGEQPQNINAVFMCYHMMLYAFGLVVISLIVGLLVSFKKLDVTKRKWPLYLMMIGWLGAILSIQFGWCTAELGRQPWIVYGELLTAEATSQAVDVVQLVITLVLFAVVYTVIYVVWIRSFLKTVKAGPEAIQAADEAKANTPKLDVEVTE